MKFHITNHEELARLVQYFNTQVNIQKIDPDFEYIHIHFAHPEDSERVAEGEVSPDEVIELIGKPSKTPAWGMWEMNDPTLVFDFAVWGIFFYGKNYTKISLQRYLKNLEKQLELNYTHCHTPDKTS